jgi:hypothetical protein
VGKWWTYLIAVVLAIVLTAVVGWAAFYKPTVGSLSGQLSSISAELKAVGATSVADLIKRNNADEARLVDADSTAKLLEGQIGQLRTSRDSAIKQVGELRAIIAGLPGPVTDAGGDSLFADAISRSLGFVSSVENYFGIVGPKDNGSVGQSGQSGSSGQGP